MFSLKGVYTAMMTPFDCNGQLNIPEIRKMTDFFIEKGVDGIFPVSNIGEHIQLSEQEKQIFVNTVIEEANNRVKIIPGISAAGTNSCISFGRYCADAGADAVVIAAPHYFNYPQDVVYGHIAAAAKNVNLPFVLYNIEKFANPITPATLNRLLEIDNISAMKDSSGSIPELLKFLDVADKKEGFGILVGWEEMFVSALSVGASGCMCASGGIFPEIMAAIHKFFIEGKLDKATALQRIIGRAMAFATKIYFPYGYQAAFQARGFDLGKPRVTFDESVFDKERKEIFTAVETALKEFRTFMEGIND